MKPILNSFKMFIKEILRDSMLAVVLISPILAGIAFHFGIPFLDNIIVNKLNIDPIFQPYYLLFDLFLAILTPYMFCFASSMVIISEFDDNIANYISVTPVGKTGYLVSRLVFPSIISCFIGIIVLLIFSLSNLPLYIITLLSVFSSILCIIPSLIIVSFSKNKVEGMAFAKLSGLILIGIIIPFFIHDNNQYIFSFMPSFWISKFALTSNILFSAFAIFSSLIWIYFLYKIFIRRYLR